MAMEMDYPINSEQEFFSMEPEKPKTLTPLTPEALVYLETNIENFRLMKSAGVAKNILAGGLYLVMIRHFDTNYKKIDESSWDSLFKFMTDLYRYYDKWKAQRALTQ